TPETITSYTYDAAGRQLSVRRDIGAMTTTESTKYDLLGRVIKQTDVLGRETTTEYSEDGLITTISTPAGATFITTRNPDGSTASVAGTGQREIHYTYNLDGKNRAVTETLADGTFLSKTVTDGFDQTVVETTPSMTGFIYNRKQYNAKGQLIKEQKDNGYNATKMAATLLEYDSFGNVSRQTLALADMPTKDNSPVVEISYAEEIMEDGVYNVTTQTRYNTEGNPLVSTQKQLISQLSSSMASKRINIDVRGNASVNWSVYSAPAKVTTFSFIPSSAITAESISVDGFTLQQKDTTGITTTATRQYTASGMQFTKTDGRGNATTTVTDLAGRTTSVTDAAGNTTTTAYDAHHDAPATITDELGNTTCYRYDVRGRKVAEWGTAIQPACFSYDDMDNMTMLMTFRGTPDTNADGSPSQSGKGAAAGDRTTWNFDPASGLEISKTYADNSSVVKTYDAFKRLATETDARGIVKTHSYEVARGLLLGISYSDTTTARSYTYNHLGQLTQVTDDAGVRTIGYNQYGEQETDSLLAGGKTHLITETRDAMGRSTGYVYSKDGSTQQTVTTGYGTDGRIATAGFLHGGVERQFSYAYLPGTNLLQQLTLPSNMTLTQSYEPQRDLLTGMLYKRGSTAVSQRSYTYDALGRPLTRSTSRNRQTINDSFGYNNRSELTTATVSNGSYAYDYDNIGNRKSAQEAAESATSYESNQLNQYTAIGGFEPSYDDAGNQTKVKTSTGIWSVVYNAENRPTSFTNADSGTIVECTYDYMGRRASKKVTVNGSVALHQRFLYRGYLQIACCDLTRSNHPCLWLITWDPSQPVATRPLAIQKDGTWYTYGWDLTKNICEVYGQHGYMRTNYTYTPYGEATISGDVIQPLQWSSEYLDSELGLTYYNYRHYNPSDGKWLTYDCEKYSINLYNYCKNNPAIFTDRLGLFIEEEYPQYAVDFIAEIAEGLKNYGREMGLSDNDIIATAMALAEEYSARENYFGIKRVLDELQDWICRNEFRFVIGNDFGKGNINQNTARSVDLTPLDKVAPPEKKALRQKSRVNDGLVTCLSL
ncbi:MAG: RHS repeat-associated core domain-containing protein, partial [Akkermansia sp.]|nr:RHS repeat-associated core domain-containing protein [Akkermansia sp.]